MKRVFTPDERERISGAKCPDAMLWSLWAAKETAYKIVRKISPDVSSVPVVYGVTYGEEAEQALSGAVNTPCGRVAVRSFINLEYVHCIGVSGSPNDINDVIWGVEENGETEESTAVDESLCARQTAGRRLVAYLHAAPGEIDIRRPESSTGLGPPLVYCRGIHTEIDISLSHDGRFVAYAFSKNNLT